MSLGSLTQDNILRYLLLTCLSESIIPTIVQSVGVSSRLKGKLASFPRHQKTNSPTPAPAASIATKGLPCGARFLSSDWTMSSLRPSSEGFFIVATTVPMTRASCMFVNHQRVNRRPRPENRKTHVAVYGLESSVGGMDIHRIDHLTDGRVDRRILHVLRQTRAGAGHDEHAFMKAGADRIHGDDIATRVSAVKIDGPNDEQLFSFQPFV